MRQVDADETSDFLHASEYFCRWQEKLGHVKHFLRRNDSIGDFFLFAYSQLQQIYENQRSVDMREVMSE